MADKVKVLILRLVYGGSECAALGSWLFTTALGMTKDPRIAGFQEIPLNMKGIPEARNFAVEIARESGANYLLTADADTHPDIERGPTFWETAFNFAYSHNGPCVVSAPVQMRNGLVNVHKEEFNAETGMQDLILRSAAECANLKGIYRVPACGMGLMLIDMRCFDELSPPYFRFGYEDERCCKIERGEDGMFTADLGGPDIPVYVAWDCWAGHWQNVLFGRPSRRPRIAIS